jgi:hypothetical protein
MSEERVPAGRVEVARLLAKANARAEVERVILGSFPRER